jgi:hypothetical protein
MVYSFVVYSVIPGAKAGVKPPVLRLSDANAASDYFEASR